ncbi:MAG: hypothetical protein LBR65_08540 [Culturomica sp.]|jgi:hypothetical protein|nr:hypothetical protein [Culturomica sp.]
MDREQVISLLACVAVLCGIVLTTLFLLLFFYKKNHPEEWKRTKIILVRWIVKKEKLRKEDLPPAPKYKEQYLTKKRFEDFLRKKRPFLNPDLKIAELTRPLLTNQRSLSTFIRRTYNMEFEQCMNYFRFREVERLQYLGPIRNAIALSVKAGFWSYNVYLRTKEELAKREAAREAAKNQSKTTS